MLSPPEHAAALIAHYLWALAERSGLRWTSANKRDMQSLAELLGHLPDEPPTEELPPYQPIVSDRRTIVLDRGGQDPQFERWRAQRRLEADDAATRRMLKGERGAR